GGEQFHPFIARTHLAGQAAVGIRHPLDQSLIEHGPDLTVDRGDIQPQRFGQFTQAQRRTHIEPGEDQIRRSVQLEAGMPAGRGGVPGQQGQLERQPRQRLPGRRTEITRIGHGHHYVARVTRYPNCAPYTRYVSYTFMTAVADVSSNTTDNRRTPAPAVLIATLSTVGVVVSLMQTLVIPIIPSLP